MLNLKLHALFLVFGVHASISFAHPRGWDSNRPSQGPGSTGARLPQSGALLGLVEGLCGAEKIGVGCSMHCTGSAPQGAGPSTSVIFLLAQDSCAAIEVPIAYKAEEFEN